MNVLTEINKSKHSYIQQLLNTRIPTQVTRAQKEVLHMCISSSVLTHMKVDTYAIPQKSQFLEYTKTQTQHQATKDSSRRA